VIKIVTVGKNRIAGLIRSDDDHGWLASPVGMAGRAGSGPPGATCAGCAHLALEFSQWTDHGRGAPCLEHRRLKWKNGQVVPTSTPACNRFFPRPGGVEAALAAANPHVEAQIASRRQRLAGLGVDVKKIEGEICELEPLLESGAVLDREKAEEVEKESPAPDGPTPGLSGQQGV
jgi:hypothetical protein